MEPTKSAMIRTAGRWPAQVPSWLVGRLWLGVGHASTVRPDPSTLGVMGERGSHHEGWPARSRPLALSLARLPRSSQNMRWRSPSDACPAVASGERCELRVEEDQWA